MLLNCISLTDGYQGNRGHDETSDRFGKKRRDGGAPRARGEEGEGIVARHLPREATVEVELERPQPPHHASPRYPPDGHFPSVRHKCARGGQPHG